MPFLPFPDPPVPVGAVIVDSIVTVTFDQPLQSATLATSNWAVHHDGATFGVNSAIASGSTVELMLAFGVPGPGVPGVSYAASPADVVSVAGVPAEAFANYPFG